jgi:hypothetical protein
MPWQPFRRKIKHKQLTNDELETSFDDVLPRSVSDGNLVRYVKALKIDKKANLNGKGMIIYL